MGTVNHQNPFWFYIPIYLGGFFPWSVVTLFSARRYVSMLKQRWLPTRRANLELFSIIWLVFVLTIFSLLKTKLATYILPVAPPLAILSGSLLDRVVRYNHSKPLSWALLAFIILVGPLLAIFAPVICFKIGVDISTLYAAVGFGFFVWCFFVIATIAAFRKKVDASITSIVCACAFACGTFVPTALQYHYIQSDLPLFHLLRRVVRDKAQVALYMRDSPAVNFYLRRPIREIKTLLDYKLYLEAGRKPHYLLVTSDIMKQMKEAPATWILLDKRSKWHLFKVDP